MLICVNIALDVHSQSQSWYTHWIQIDRNPTIVLMAKSHGFWRISPQINAHLVAQVFVSDHHHLRGYHPLNSLKCHEMSHKWKTIYIVIKQMIVLNTKLFTYIHIYLCIYNLQLIIYKYMYIYIYCIPLYMYMYVYTYRYIVFLQTRRFQQVQRSDVTAVHAASVQGTTVLMAIRIPTARSWVWSRSCFASEII